MVFRLFRLMTAVCWFIALLALAGALRVPGRALDIYLNDRYFVISKLTLLSMAALFALLPIAVLMLRRPASH